MEKNSKKEEETVKNSKLESDRIWDEIKDLNIQMFSLPNQPLSNFCKPRKVEPTRLYLETNVPSLLATLDSTLSSKFLVDRFENLITIQRKQ